MCVCGGGGPGPSWVWGQGGGGGGGCETGPKTYSAVHSHCLLGEAGDVLVLWFLRGGGHGQPSQGQH